MGIVVLVNGAVMMFMALLMAVDAALFPSTDAEFVEAAVLAGPLGLFLVLAGRGSRQAFHRLHTFVLTATVWLAASLIGALPFWIWGLSPVDAVFEAMSGITTTGSTVMVGLDTTPRGILFWRALLQMMGGVGFVVTAMALLPMLRVGGMQLYRTESSDKDERELGSVVGYASATLTVYACLLGLAAVTYRIGGMSLFDAATHAMTTVSTGGFSNYDASFGHFPSPFLHWSATLFMLAGALPFAWYIRAATRRQFRSEQVTAMLWSLAAVILALSAWVSLTQKMNPLDALRLVAFNVVSVVTTTGYMTTDYLLWGPVAVVAFFLLTPVGGCTGSTAGGAKALRWVIALRSIRLRIRTIDRPDEVTVLRYNGRRVADDVLGGVVSFLVFYFATAAVIATVLGAMELDISTAISGALTALANVGPGVGPVIGPAGNFATLPDPAKLVLAFGMYVGRLEMLTVLVLLTPAFWRAI